MPYASTADIPEAARKKLSPHQQEIFRAAFNNALKEYDDESKAFATAWAAAKKGGSVAKSEGDGMSAVKKETAMERLLKAIRPGSYPKQDDEDDGPPSQEDREKEAAPVQAPPSDDEGGDQADDDDRGEDRGTGADDQANGDDDGGDQDDEGDDEEQNRQAPPPPRKMPVRKSLRESDDDALMAEVARRIEVSPDFLKSIAADEAWRDNVLQAVDMSEVVAYIVHSASEQLAAKDVTIAQLTKSLQEFQAAHGEMVKGTDTMMEAMAIIVENQEALTKSVGAVAGDVALIKSADSGRVSLGQDQRTPPERSDPKSPADDDPERRGNLPQGMDKSRISRTLMKAMTTRGADGKPLIMQQQWNTLMGELDGMEGPAGVWDKLPDPIKELALAG